MQKPKHPFTDEQLAVINVDNSFHILFVIAYAGAGKTTVLVAFAKKRYQSSFLYLAFNKSIVNEAKGGFPDNTTVITVHSLAYRAVGRHFVDKLADNMSVGDISDYVASITKFKQSDLYMFCYACVRTLNNYMSNADIDLGGEHIEQEDLEFIMQVSSIDTVLDVSTMLWNKMCDTEDQQVKMVHDGYLKLYQLTNPQLDYDCILVDEAQDCNPVVLSILSRQKAKLVMVGDPHQSIYGFRGAVNAFQNLTPCVTLYLTTSFRFGENVAEIANEILKRKAIDVPPVHGMGEDEIVPIEELLFGSEPYMDISRSSTGLFSVMAENERFFAEHGLAKDYHFVGGVRGYNFNRFICAYNLYQNKLGKINSADLKTFGSWGDLKATATLTNNPQLSSLVTIVERYQASIVPMVINLNNSHEKARNADVFISTGHKSKGLEKDNVIIRPDFMRDSRAEPCNGTPESIALDQELNLLYVAATRPRKKLAIAPSPLSESFGIMYGRG